MPRLPWATEPDTKIIECTWDDYQRGRSHYMTSHMLETFEESPRLCRQKMRGLFIEDRKAAYELGTAAHSFILEGPAEFHRRFVVAEGPINQRTGKPFGRDTKAFEDWLAEMRAEGKEPVMGSEFEDIQQMAESIEESVGADLLHYGKSEVTIRGQNHGVPCQSRFDFLNIDGAIFVDLKTTESIHRFTLDFERFGYARQLAFYRSMFAGLGLGRVPQVFVLAVEKNQPYRVRVIELSESTLSAAESLNTESLKQYRHLVNTIGDSRPWPRSLTYGVSREIL